MVRPGRLPGLRLIPARIARVRPDMVMFDSWHGKYADNPRAISEELRRRDAPFEHVWVIEDGGEEPPYGTVVRPHSLDYLRHCGRARYLVTNGTMPGYFRKRAATTYVQTWHGTPLKRIGFDIEQPAFRGGAEHFQTLGREVRDWDFLVSPNAFSTSVFRRAFRYEGPVLEAGYPRTDRLLASDRDTVRARVRAELGIGDDVRAVLYAPTWRDNDTFSTELDMAALAEALGDGSVVLLRAHDVVAATVRASDHPAVRDVSRHAEPGELLLAADVLVTDYSSVMFDFAVTGKPMVFFTYDLDFYRDELRGFYFDLPSEAPGPLVASTAELIEALSDLDSVSAHFAEAYEQFRRRFCHLDDGRAAERVVDAVFGA